jgi:Domain of unknown function (DUF4178)
LATEPPTSGPPPHAQRAWRAACPGCGAPVEFASAASASAVCSFCRSTVVRDGDALRRIGVSAELFDDHSPLQLGVRGRHQGVAFTLVGRLQYAYADGTWNEWHVLFDAASPQGTPKPAWLSEDNGAYVLAFDVTPAPPDLPAADELHAGERRLVAGSAWSVASVVRARLLAAEGELPRPPQLAGEFIVADLRSTGDEVGTLDYADPARPGWSVGRSVALSALSLSGLKEASEKTLAGRTVACPSCGATLSPSLSSTQSMSCPQCRAVVDLSQGVGGELAHFAQNNSGPGGLQPQIPLGSTGRLTLGAEGPLDWTVVGYMERCDLPGAGDDEQTFWREYLLYHRTAGFAFLVDAQDGWSWVRPMTGAPLVSGRGAKVQDTAFTERWRYAAKVTWVLGEFYWRVKRDERALVTDYDGPRGAKLSREQASTGKAKEAEVVWSLGQAIDAATVAGAFRIAPDARASLSRDAGPLSGLSTARAGTGGLSQGLIILVVVVAVILLMSRCSGDDCDDTRATFGQASAEYQQCVRNQRSGGFRSAGGAFGGFSSGGGGHK